MYPTAIRFGWFEVTTFGVMMAAGVLVGLWSFTRELRLAHLPADAGNGAIAGVLGGLLGAKLLFASEHLGEPLVSLLASRGGLSWFGGLFGGIAVALVYFRWRHFPLIPIVAAATPGLALGHLLGRVGCFLVGDDYGRPSTLPWAIAFPRGLPPTDIPVHPTQLYEAACLAGLAWLLIRWRRANVPSRLIVGRYLVLSGTVRFWIEFLRVNPRVMLGLTVAQCGAVLAVVLGAALLRPED